ncbi:hypothetical protein [Legionella worsleiensis]|uniref:Uncharacterized protein n=1 Tax=Legionella worsleiensis TaxID=45076 RepID=A0A0W1A9F1_9GAMM|nr:hypothetical protein [Legionella worsleiensis]KTD77926.1 hypothetical protein Lwor_1808 [Legionella worsleiensis]STY33128.1 Uncharacterised protein [Legionella worsleiensis]
MSVNKLRSILKSAFPNLSKIFSEKEGVQQYRKILTYFLKDGVIDPLELEQLKYVENKYELTEEEIRKIQRKVLSTYFNEIISDKRISEEERKTLQELLNLFSLQTNEINFDQKIFNKYYTLGLIEQGSLPSVENKDKLNIILKPNEILHYRASSQLNKIKKVTKRINYGGLTGSIKIMKGVRYRIGSIGVQTKTQEILDTEDVGILYITNQRIGFKGHKKQFNILFNKILSFELFAEGIFLFKQGKETPYILTLDDYEIPLTILSFLLNN